jgi:hypothetical protein
LIRLCCGDVGSDIWNLVYIRAVFPPASEGDGDGVLMKLFSIALSLIIKISFSLKMASNFHHFIYNTYLSVLDTVSNRTSLYCKSSSYTASTTWLILDSSFPAFPRMKKRVTSLGAKRSNLIANTENRDCFVIAFLAKTVFSSSMFRWNDEECSIDA